MKEHFDLKKEFDEQVRPILDELYAKCEELKMPMHLIICYADKEDKSNCVSSQCFPDNRKPDAIVAHALLKAHHQALAPVVFRAVGAILAGGAAEFEA